MISTAGPDVTTVIVTYRSRELIDGAIGSVRAAAALDDLGLQVVVVDNASDDGTADHVAAGEPDVVVVRNARNEGFGAANNRGFDEARGRWWLLLNPDGRLERDALGRLLRTIASRPDAGAVAPAIRGGGMGLAESAGELPGVRSLAGHYLFLNRLLPGDRGGPWRGWQLRSRSDGAVREVGWASAAALLLRPEAVRAVGGFDESIFLYGEDIELCDRLRAEGWRTLLDAGAHAEHAIGGSQAPGSVRWIGGVDAYNARRGRTSVVRRTCLLIMAVGLAIRAAAAKVRAPARPDHGTRLRAGALEALRRAVTRLPAAPSRRGPPPEA